MEYDELKLFTEMGYDCYSLGAYTQPGGEEHRKRPPLKLPYDPHFIELALQYGARNIHKEMLEGVDIVIVMHTPEFLSLKHPTPEMPGNWPLFKEFIQKGGRVIWRSIGQSIPHVEKWLAPLRADGLEVVRYSPAESTIQDNVGSDAMIRFYKDPDEYKDWNGSNPVLINFTQSLKDRADFTGYKLLRGVFSSFHSRVYGPGNDNLGPALAGGLVSYEQQMQILRDNRAFIYHGTYPASYTLSLIEAMMTGIPVIAVGPSHGNSPMFPLQQTYEAHQIIDNGVSGFWSDSTTELKKFARRLLRDYNLAQAVSAAGRARAIELFGKETIKAQWAEFLER